MYKLSNWEREKVVSFVICHQLRELLETLSAILEGLPEDEKAQLPSQAVISMGMTLIDGAFPDFVGEDGKLDMESIREFSRDKERLFLSKKIYATLREKMTPDMIKRIRSRNEKYFVDNLTSLMGDLPIPQGTIGGEEVRGFEEFSANNSLSQDDKDTIWDFTEFICDVLEDEEGELNKLF